MGRTVADADSEAEPAARDLVDERGGLREVVRDAARRCWRCCVPNGISRVAERERLAEPEAVAEARAVEAGEALLLEPPGHVDRRLPSSGDGGEAHGGLARRHHETALPQRSR